MTFYLIDKKQINFQYVYYSPTLWDESREKEEEFEQRKKKLLGISFPMGTGVVGEAIEKEEPIFFSTYDKTADKMHDLSKDTGFEVTSMLTVPLKGSRVIGAIQVLNKEPFAAEKEFTQKDLKLLNEVAEYTGPLVQRMLDPGYQIQPEDTARFIARFTNCPLVLSEEECQVDERLIELVGAKTIQKHQVFPYQSTGKETGIEVLMSNPMDFTRKEAFTRDSQLKIEKITVAPEPVIEELIRKYIKEDAAPQDPVSQEDMSELADLIGVKFSSSDDKNKITKELESEESAPIIQLANRIIEDAYVAGASDIHIEPQENELLVRYRVDGRCQERLHLPKAVSGALTARIKVMSNLNIAETRLPQDGRIVFKHFTTKKIDVDLRVATGPMNFGEKIVMRLLDKKKSALPITALGFSDYNLELYRESIKQPYGMILHCGPTGSGKSMTLFSALREVSSPEINILTAEDPIEYTFPGINQMQMHRKIGLTFASALRAYLRMDPDVILVGEIRDRETAEIAVEAALTGHLLLSTLHTNDAPSTIARFTDMGIESFMISSSLLVICAQRLMRRLCPHCQEIYTPESAEKSILERAIDWSGEINRASENGCGACSGVGYKGRIGIHELLQNSDELTKGINSGLETSALKAIALRNGMKTLHQDSMLKVKEGVSSMVEALASVPPDMILEGDAKKD